ncbi:MAG: inorganic diphosphatase [Fimbriimonadaceae bacterium]|nr:inorganic diphosphatase [Fimbriimonadaceae bacterium]
MSLLTLPLGKNAPQEFNAIIEVPRYSTNKYEYDPALDMIRLDRVLFSPLFYPWDYGFLPSTKYLDGDAIDVLVLCSHPTFPGCVVEAKPIGVLEMYDEKGSDEKILAVASKDPRFGNRESMDEVNPHTLNEIHHFFEIYKLLEDKTVEVFGWKGKDVALELIEKYRTDK